MIIEETSLPIPQKSVKPVILRGQAGGIHSSSEIVTLITGEKYIIHGILFKFATDWKGIYGGDHYAMKGAR